MKILCQNLACRFKSILDFLDVDVHNIHTMKPWKYTKYNDDDNDNDNDDDDDDDVWETYVT